MSLDIKFPTKFKPLFEDMWRFIIFYGGRGSGKSFNIARALIIRAYHNPTRVVALSFGKNHACNYTITQKEQEQCS